MTDKNKIARQGVRLCKHVAV